MKVKSPDDYKLVKFRRSQTKGKKYDALLVNKKTGREKTVPFGAIGYEQYKDTTGLGLYSKQDHKDPKRRELYRKRHRGEDGNKFSSGYLSLKYLW